MQCAIFVRRDDGDADAVDHPQLSTTPARSCRPARTAASSSGTARLQTGPYLESRAHNPRSIFASPAFDYTSLEAPIVIAADHGVRRRGHVAATRLSDRSRSGADDGSTATRRAQAAPEFEIPAQAVADDGLLLLRGRRHDASRAAAIASRCIYFVSTITSAISITHHELLDIFDIGRLMRHLAWQEPLPAAAPLDLNSDGAHRRGRSRAPRLRALLPQAADPFARIRASTIGRRCCACRTARRSPCRASSTAGRPISSVDGNLAGALVSRHISFAMARRGARQRRACAVADDIKVNDVFYRTRAARDAPLHRAGVRQHLERDPIAFAAASAYRMVRLFIVRGTDDQADDAPVPAAAG